MGAKIFMRCCCVMSMMWRLIERHMSLLFMASVAVSCDVTSDYVTPLQGGGKERFCSIAYAKSLYEGYPYTFSGECFLRGVVTANDRYGNLYKRIVVEDSSGGLEIKLDRQDLYNDYFVGDSVVVNCYGLTLGAYGGLVQLGGASVDGYETSYIAASDIEHHLISTGGKAPSVEPLVLTMDALEYSHISRFVKFEGVQFVETGGGRCWTEGDEATDRILTDKHGNTIAVRTSARAMFAGELLPIGSGSISGVLSYFNKSYQLLVCRLTDVDMENARF